MSDLVLIYNGRNSIANSCVDTPPSDSSQDDCHITVQLQQQGRPNSEVRAVRFDRSGDQFVLSAENNAEIRGWFEGFRNTTAITQAVRMAGNLVRIDRDTGPNYARLLLLAANFIVTGENRLPRQEHRVSDPSVLARSLLDIFAHSNEDVMGRILGRMQVIRRASWLENDEGIRRRIQWVNGILDLVPRFNAFRRHFLRNADLNLLLSWNRNQSSWDAATRRRFELTERISEMVLDIVVANHLNRPLEFDSTIYRGIRAYYDLYGESVGSDGRPLFNEAMAQALRDLLGRDAADSPLVQRTQLVERFLGVYSEAEMPAMTLMDALIGETARNQLQASIREESAAANMPIRWFTPENGTPRTSFNRVHQIVERSLRRHIPTNAQDQFRLGFNFSNFRRQLDLAIDSNSTTRREYILLGIAFLRRFFGNDGEVPVFQAIAFEQIHEVRFRVNRDQLNEIRRYLRSLERRLDTSHEFSDTTLPILEGIACGIGVAGLVVAETVPQIRDDQGLRLGIGIPSAGLLGAGCNSFLTHFIFQPITGYRNRPLVEGVTAGVSFLGGAGLYLLLSFALGGNGNMGTDNRFPVDMYGP